MNRRVVPSGWYGDLLPTGEYVATVPKGAMQTHLGPIALPVDEGWGLVTPRCTTVNGFRFAGQAHDVVGVTWEWRPAERWVQLGPTNGVNGAIYDRAGALHRAGSFTSQGYRYVAPDGTLVLGDATYGPFHGLNEYTDLSAAQDKSFVIGQGNPAFGLPEGCLVWDGTQIRVLERGSCRFINAHRQGDRVSLAFTGPAGVVLYDGSAAEFLGLPPLGVEKVRGPIVNQLVERKQVPMSLPSLDTWLHVELPQLVAAFHQTHPGTTTPDDWYAFQTYRRYVEPEAWPFDRMLRHEQGNDGPAPAPNPQ